MNVTFVSTYFLPYVGGIEMHMAQLARGLLDRGVEVSVVCLADESGARMEELDGIPVRRVPARGIGEAIPWPGPLIAGTPDIVHFHGFSRPLFLKTILELRRRPLVVTPHGGLHGVAVDHVIFRRLVKQALDATVAGRWLGRAERILCLTNVERRDLRDRLRVDPEKLVVLPNPVDEGFLRPLEGVQGASGRLLMLTRLAPRKRIADLLSALVTYTDLPGCDIAGPDEGEGRRLRAMSAGQPPGRVEFLGTVSGPAKVRLVRRAKAVVLCSSWEGHSLSAIEALAQGTPVIASVEAAVGLQEDAVLTFPLGDIDALAERIRSLNDPGTYECLADAARRARATFLSSRQYAGRVLNLYANAIRSATLPSAT